MKSFKRKMFIPQWDALKGLSRPDWEALNRDEVVKLDIVPEAAKEYLEEVKPKKIKEKE
jgi:capsule polysaccharide modification protein KpsS